MRDPSFPSLHIRPRFGWLNDPNGLCRIDGTYHVFFQFNPVAPLHGDICWGHVTSTDLLHWREAPVALRPRPGLIDAAGCWSGCVVDDAGTPTAVYTGIPGHARNAGVTLARSDRSLMAWEQDEKPVVETPDRPGTGEVRDPFVFSFEGKRYAIQGAGERSGRPQILLYDCDDLQAWVELDPLLTDDDPIAAEVAAGQHLGVPEPRPDRRPLGAADLDVAMGRRRSPTGRRALSGGRVGPAPRRTAFPAVLGRHSGRGTCLLRPTADD